MFSLDTCLPYHYVYEKIPQKTNPSYRVLNNTFIHPKHSFADSGTSFASQLLIELMQASGIKIDRSTEKHRQTTRMVEQIHHTIKRSLVFNVTADTPHWERGFNSAVKANNTTYHQSIKCNPTDNFHGRILHNKLDLKNSNPLQLRLKESMWRLVKEVNQNYLEYTSNTFKVFQM